MLHSTVHALGQRLGAEILEEHTTGAVDLLEARAVPTPTNGPVHDRNRVEDGLTVLRGGREVPNGTTAVRAWLSSELRCTTVINSSGSHISPHTFAVGAAVGVLAADDVFVGVAPGHAHGGNSGGSESESEIPRPRLRSKSSAVPHAKVASWSSTSPTASISVFTSAGEVHPAGVSRGRRAAVLAAVSAAHTRMLLRRAMRAALPKRGEASVGFPRAASERTAGSLHGVSPTAALTYT